MRLADVVATYRPESHGRGEDWEQHAVRLLTDEPMWMHQLALMMEMLGWYGGPVLVDDGVVQDGHHRVVVALGLGWDDRDIPVQATA